MKIFDDFGTELPDMTQALIVISDWRGPLLVR